MFFLYIFGNRLSKIYKVFLMIIKNELNANSLFATMRDFFSTVTDQRSSNRSISLKDALMSGFAMF